jgi:hypothetical protein
MPCISNYLWHSDLLDIRFFIFKNQVCGKLLDDRYVKLQYP